VTATHTLRGKSGKESPGDKSYIPAKGIRLTKIGERSNSNVAYADERDTPGLFSDEIPVEQCLPSVSGGGPQFITFVGFQRHGLGVPPTRGGHQLSAGQRQQRTRPSDEGRQEEGVGGVAGDCNGTIVTGILAKLQRLCFPARDARSKRWRTGERMYEPCPGLAPAPIARLVEESFVSYLRVSVIASPVMLASSRHRRMGKKTWGRRQQSSDDNSLKTEARCRHRSRAL
jgi:hypothetical protein